MCYVYNKNILGNKYYFDNSLDFFLNFKILYQIYWFYWY